MARGEAERRAGAGSQDEGTFLPQSHGQEAEA